jgi:hypothetical protein
LLTGAAELLLTGGAPLQPSVPPGISPRRRGFRVGLFMLMLMIILAPIVGMISAFGFGIEPWPVGLVVFGLGGGGILRILYALMFESRYPSALPPGSFQHAVDAPSFETYPLRPELGDPAASEYIAPKHARPLKTNDLEPSSITERTTRHLEKDK